VTDVGSFRSERSEVVEGSALRVFCGVVFAAHAYGHLLCEAYHYSLDPEFRGSLTLGASFDRPDLRQALLVCGGVALALGAGARHKEGQQHGRPGKGGWKQPLLPLRRGG